MRLLLLRRLLICSLLLGLGVPEIARGSFALGLQDSALLAAPSDPALAQAYGVLGQIRGNTVRITLPWAAVAPPGTTKPHNFDAANPADPHYRYWPTVDVWVKDAARYHARVMLTILSAPQWAQGAHPPAYFRQYGGSWDPNPSELGAFARAAAIRYSGHFADPAAPGTFLPHVKYWEIWNEENLPQDLGAPNLVESYRHMLNASYTALKGIDPGAQVELGGFAPVSFERGSISPLAFAAQLMCLHRSGRHFVRNRRCPQPARFDIFSIHPYTLAATPTKHAYHYDDVLIGDMSKVGTLVRTADRLRTVLPRMRHQIWVTEWSWFTNPPDKPIGDSPQTAARYTAYSIFEMWRAGASMLIWFVIQDPDLKGSNTPQFVLGGGLYDKFGRPKPMLRAFSFPMIASVQHRRGFTWGRAPTGNATSVVIERRRGRRWQAVARVRSGVDGVFTARFAAPGNGTYRARVPHGPTSLGYDSRPIPPRRTHLFYSG